MALGTLKSPLIAYKGSTKNECWTPHGGAGWDNDK